jgi:hypothetical protein
MTRVLNLQRLTYAMSMSDPGAALLMSSASGICGTGGPKAGLVALS